MDAQYAKAYAALYRNHWWWRVREGILLKKIGTLLNGRHDARILDVGCGAGLFFDALQPYGHVEGIEPDRMAVEQSGRWRNRITVGELDDVSLPARPFDLILMLDILEHTQDPERVLRRATAILAPAGIILITVPGLQALWTVHDDINHHVRRYSSREMRALIARAGLVTVTSGYFFQSLALLKLLVRLREALSRQPMRVPRIPPPAINRAIGSWYRAEYAVARWLPFGGSLFAVAARATT